MRLPQNAITIPTLAKAVGLSPQRLYDLIDAGDGPAIRPPGKYLLIPFDSAILWVEDRLRGRLSPARRLKAEDALKDLRVSRAFYRAAALRRTQQSARRCWNYTPTSVEAA